MPKKKTNGPMEIVNTGKARLLLPDGTALLPGANRVSDTVVSSVRDSAPGNIVKVWLVRGLIQLREQVVTVGETEYDLAVGLPQSLYGLTPDVIKRAISLCQDKDQLFKWLEGAGDPEVRQLIQDRGYELGIESAANESTVGTN